MIMIIIIIIIIIQIIVAIITIASRGTRNPPRALRGRPHLYT